MEAQLDSMMEEEKSVVYSAIANQQNALAWLYTNTNVIFSLLEFTNEVVNKIMPVKYVALSIIKEFGWKI
jgi:hypothetical protein